MAKNNEKIIVTYLKFAVPLTILYMVLAKFVFNK